MLACCSPLSGHSKETFNILHIAEPTLDVKSQPVVILEPQDQMISDSHATIKALRDENRLLVEQMRMAVSAPPAQGALLELASTLAVPATAPQGAAEASPKAIDREKLRKASLGKDTLSKSCGEPKRKSK